MKLVAYLAFSVALVQAADNKSAPPSQLVLLDATLSQLNQADSNATTNRGLLSGLDNDLAADKFEAFLASLSTVELQRFKANLNYVSNVKETRPLHLGCLAVCVLSWDCRFCKHCT